MTLQNGLLTPDAAYLWSETGMFTWQEKRLIGHDPCKILAGSGWPWALLHSGTYDVWEPLECSLGIERVASLGALVERIQWALQPHLSHDWPNGQRVLIAAYEGGPHLILVTTEEMGGYPPLTPLPIRTHMISGGSEAITREVAKGVTVESMARIIRQQHADCMLDDNWPLSGKVTRARVSCSGVELDVVDELPEPMAA